ncbi:MAG: DUF58 domain-containing protein [Mariprofundaceae bacterium]|nr:DUF58 domain-containing protein [Mariprofundaceae bacterium]
MAYDPSDLRLPPWLLKLLNALIRLRIPIAPHWKIGMTRAGGLMFFSLLGLWSAAFYSGNNLLYLCGGMLLSIAFLACIQGIQILRHVPKLGHVLPTVLEQGVPHILRQQQAIETSASAMIEVVWNQADIHMQINMQRQRMTIMAHLFSKQRACTSIAQQQLSTAAPLGLWQLEYQRQDAALWLVLAAPVAWSETQSLGEVTASQRIDGDEYDDLRAYVAGDSIARIHWRKSTLNPDTWRIKRFTQAQPSHHQKHVRVDLRLPAYANEKDFDRLLGMAWYWLKKQGQHSHEHFILGQQYFDLAVPTDYQAAIKALAQAKIESMPPLQGEGMLLSL